MSSISSDAGAVLTHLQMIQDVIKRMAHCSFQLKQWSIIVFSAKLSIIISLGYLSYVPSDLACFSTILVIIPFMVFWAMDAFYLRQERAYRKLYDIIRAREKTNYDMAVTVDDISYFKCVISRTLFYFYFVQILTVSLFEFIILKT